MDVRIRSLVDARPRDRAPDLDAIEKWLGAPLALDRDAGAWRFFVGPIAREPFAKADARVAKAGGRAFVVLEAAAEPPFTEAALGLGALGEPKGVDINPRVPPEGTIAYSYALDGVEVAFTFTYRSRRLLSVSFAWD